MWNGRRLIAKVAEVYAEVYKNARRHPRLPAKFTGTMSGPFGTIYVTGIDLNRDGAGVQSPQDLPIGTMVFLKINELGVLGFGHVRHCSAHSHGYCMGIEFREPLARDRDATGDWEYERYGGSARQAWDETES